MVQDIPEILSLFKEQLGNQISAIVKEQSFQNDGYGFAYWYFRNVSASVRGQALPFASSPLSLRT